MKKKILLIDGHSILTRAFFGLPLLTAPDGRPTNGVLGFVNIMLSIMKEEEPTHIAVGFDLKAPTFRHRMFEGYKGTRKPMPDDLHRQVPIIKEVLTSMGIPILTKEGYEADDILGTMARKAEAEGYSVRLLSGDRDLLQIATDTIMVRIPKTKGGSTTIENYYADDVRAAYGVSGQGFIELKALMGDSSDNIPGVPKVGEKTAKELMVTYGSLQGIYDNIDSITKKAIKQSLIDNRELADLSLELATICTDAPIEFDIDEALLDPNVGIFTADFHEMCKSLGFRALLARFKDLPAASSGAAVLTMELPEVFSLGSGEALMELTKGLDSGSCVGVCLLTDGGQKEPVMLGVSIHDKGVFTLVGQELTASFLTVFFEKLHKAGIMVAAERLSAIYPYTPWLADIDYDDMRLCFDAVLCAYLLNPLKSDYSLADVAMEQFSLELPVLKTLVGKRSLKAVLSDDGEALQNLAGHYAHICRLSRDRLLEKLEPTGMYSLYFDTELPLSYILYDMERQGIRVEREALREFGDRLSVRIDELESAIHQAAGEEFNINSPKQLGEILFDKMGLKGGKKTKTGYSTAADVLEKLAEDYPIVADILEYRGLSKLRSTYAEGLIDYIGRDGLIHTHFNQTVTATGRLSSSDPNLQNIPMRTELGRSIRKVFIPSDGCIFTDADYSQIELRILAHMSGDPNLIESYESEADIHRLTASKVFNVPFDEVTDLQRRNAKAVNFGIVYGISGFGLSQDLSISRKEAQQYIEDYFKTYPAIKSFLDGCVKSAKETGYAVTLYGRRRPIPELRSSNFMQRSFGERVAMNAPIQGTAADIMKFAMIGVYRALREGGFRSKLILQIHDELLIDTRIDEAVAVREILRREMEKAADLKVRLETDLNTGSDWFEAK